ncbi:MAG: hypothetical protein GY765_16585, partial [bacterium]|nr:hypothetical protein [bacterium]
NLLEFRIFLAALREAVLNAVAHRDYRATANIQVYIFNDRVEIVNPGGRT